MVENVVDVLIHLQMFLDVTSQAAKYLDNHGIQQVLEELKVVHRCPHSLLLPEFSERCDRPLHQARRAG